MKKPKFMLSFWGAAYPDSGDAREVLSTAKRDHDTLESAIAEAGRITERLPNPAAHPPMYYRVLYKKNGDISHFEDV